MFVLPLLIRFQSKCWEAFKSTIVTNSKEPLEETPQEAEGKELSQFSQLFPADTSENEKVSFKRLIAINVKARNLDSQIASYIASLSLLGLLKLLITCAVALPLGYVNFKSSIII